MAVTESKIHDKRMSGAALVERHKKRVNDTGGAWDKHYRDIRDYVQPDRVRLEKGEQSGRNRTTKIYDSTAVVAAWRGAQKMQDVLTPSGKQWMEVAPGAMVTNPDQKARLKRLLDDVSKLAWMVLDQGDYGAAAPQFFRDVYSGTGHMMILKGSGTDKLIDYITLPAEAVVVEEDGSGDVCRWFFHDRLEIGQIRDRWPDAKFDKQWEDLMRSSNGTKEVELSIVCSRQKRTDPTRPPAFDLQVLRHEDGFECWHEELRTSCFITARLFKVPGETRGRGFPMLAMPHIKTLNKAKELQLKAAAFAVLGSWMTNDDGVYNPRTSVLTPGGMLKVKSTGGRRGPSIADLGLPKQFDVAALVSDEMRDQIKEMMLDDKLPPEQGAVRSPTEIIARMRQLTNDIAGHFGTLYREIIIPLVKRVLDILDQWDLLPSMVRIDNLFVTVRVLAPLADTQALDEADRAVRWFSTAINILGPEQIDLVADRVRLARYLHDVMNAPQDAMKSPEETRKAMKEAAQLGAQAIADQQQQEAPQNAGSGQV